MRLCDLDEIKVCVDRQYENCHGYSGSKKAIYREAILAVKSILHSAKPIDAVEVVRCKDCKYCDISLVLPTGRKMYNCMEGSHDHQTLLKSNDFCSRGEMRKDREYIDLK